MRKTRAEMCNDSTICVSREALPQLLGCGQATADKLARAAGARIKVGKRILIKIDTLNAYLNTITE